MDAARARGLAVAARVAAPGGFTKPVAEDFRIGAPAGGHAQKETMPFQGLQDVVPAAAIRSERAGVPSMTAGRSQCSQGRPWQG
jgi:hypothetical protein